MYQLLKFIFVVIFLQTTVYGQYQKSEINNMRSDTLDVLSYEIEFDLSDISAQHISASAEVTVESQMNDVASISLDLLDFTIDSVKQASDHISYSYNDSLLVANFLNPLDENDVASIVVYYQGTPQTDPSGLGGFYFTGGGAFNFGVGLTAQPHNYGRVWHPCFDNFVERATYDITFITPSHLFAYSAGELVDDYTDTDGNNVRQWVIEDPIQTYLMGFAAYEYTHVSDSYTSISGQEIPIMLAAEPSDTTNVKNSFINLKNALAAYEEAFGPYVWDKVGYFFVPFNQAAMEHATGIIYPQIIANGSLNFETIMAHELSHHWFGNLVTCKTASDMWINEAFATFCEPLFLEKVYGYDDYIDELKDFHYTAIQQAHFDDGAFLPLSGVPSSATYGTHTYRKGATVVHNLRTYLGDNNFFDGLTQLFDENPFTSMDAETFRNELANFSGQNLDDFFDGWIFNAGYPGFNVDSFQVEDIGGSYDVGVFVKQRLHHAPDFFNNVPMQITFVDKDWEIHHETIAINGEDTHASFNIPFEPEMIYLNHDNGILHATTAENFVVKSTMAIMNDYSYITLIPSNVTDSSLVRVEHHRTGPDNFENSSLNHQFEISPDRFWRIDGVFEEGVSFDAHFNFDARDFASANLDSGLVNNISTIDFHEDSIILLWREDGSREWRVHEDYEINSLGGSPQNGRARIIANDLKKGEYTFAVRVNIANLDDIANLDEKLFDVYPNPTTNEFKVNYSSDRPIDLLLLDGHGRLISEYFDLKNEESVDVSTLEKGTYFIIINDLHNSVVGKKKLIIH